MEEQAANAVKTGVQLSSIIAHVKENNVAYLVALLLAHSIGLIAEAQTYAAGVC
jgi:hypothetical protein